LLIHIKHREGTSNFETSFRNRAQQGITYSDEEAGLVDEGTDHDEVSKDDADKLGHFETESSSCPSNSHSVKTVELDNEFNQNTSRSSTDSQSLDNTCFASVSTPRNRKRPWSKENKKKSNDCEMQKQMMKTMTSIQEAMSKSIDSTCGSSEMRTDANDADRLFCLSLVEQMQALDTRVKSMVKIKILQIIHDAHWQGTMTFDAQNFDSTYQRKSFVSSRSMYPQQHHHHNFHPFYEANRETHEQTSSCYDEDCL